MIFLDDDNIPDDPNFIDKLMSADTDIVSALVPSRTPFTYREQEVFPLCVFKEKKLNT